MNKQDKPRICEVLGVEVGEIFTINKKDVSENFVVSPNGTVIQESPVRGIVISAIDLAWIINHPESIVRRKRFTEQEIEDAKALKRVVNRMNTIRRLAGGELWLETKDSDMHISMSFGFPGNDSAFPSIAPGESYTLDEIIGEG